MCRFFRNPILSRFISQLVLTCEDRFSRRRLLSAKRTRYSCSLTSNPVIETIKARRSTRQFKEELPERSVIEQIIEASTYAPNHHLTEPWRFVVVSGEARIRLGEAMAASLREKESMSAPSASGVELEKKKPLRAPVIICLVCSPQLSNEKVLVQEETVACGAALQNMLLAIQSLGLASWVRTGASAYSEAVRQYLNLEPNEFLIGMVYIGIQAEPPPSSKRSAASSKVIWQDH